jgi:hypothetical protein
MAHQVPWLVEQALHQAEVGRQLAYAAFQGQEGVTGALDCQVAALDIPGPFIRALPGSYAVLNRAPGYPNQMYTGRITSEDVVPVQNTTSSGGRTDLVVIRILNPDTEGVAPPQNRDSGPYAVTQLIQNVPVGTTTVAELNLGYSAIALARLQIPPSTSAIQANMITNLRDVKQTPVAAPSSFVDVANYTSNSTLPPPPNGSGTRYSAWVSWPSAASWQVPVPTWATEAHCYYSVNPTMLDNTWGELRFNFNGTLSPNVMFDVNFPMFSGTNLCYATNDGGLRGHYVVGSRLAVGANSRGKTVPVRIEARTIDATSYRARGSSLVDRGSVGYCAIHFKQAAVQS